MARAEGPEGDRVREAMRSLVNAKHYDDGMGHVFSDGVQRWEHDQAAILKGSGVGNVGGDETGKKVDELIKLLETKGILIRTQ
jgi:hypothetical protein